jgi:hypothetical protein
MNPMTYLNNCPWGMYQAALFDGDLEQAEALWLLIDGCSGLNGVGALALLRELGLML